METAVRGEPLVLLLEHLTDLSSPPLHSRQCCKALGLVETRTLLAVVLGQEDPEGRSEGRLLSAQLGLSSSAALGTY